MKEVYFILISLILITIISCQKKDDLGENTTDKISIDSLIANYHIVKAWDTTTITCYATGDSLTLTTVAVTVAWAVRPALSRMV